MLIIQKNWDRIIIDFGANYGVVLKTGNTYTLALDREPEIKLGVGRDKAKDMLYTMPDKMEKAKAQILAKFKASSNVAKIEGNTNDQLEGSPMPNQDNLPEGELED